MYSLTPRLNLVKKKKKRSKIQKKKKSGSVFVKFLQSREIWKNAEENSMEIRKIIFEESWEILEKNLKGNFKEMWKRNYKNLSHIKKIQLSLGKIRGKLIRNSEAIAKNIRKGSIKNSMKIWQNYEARFRSNGDWFVFLHQVTLTVLCSV